MAPSGIHLENPLGLARLALDRKFEQVRAFPIADRVRPFGAEIAQMRPSLEVGRSVQADLALAG